MRRSSFVLSWALLLALVFAALIWYGALREDRRGLLTVSFLDVGQGDAIFIDAPSGRQVLVDGGPDSSALRELPRVMPWWDRSIDVVVATHPDADHIGGLVDVLARYKVSTIVRSSVHGETALASTFEKRAHQEGAQMLFAERGQVIDLGKGARLEILFPDRDVPELETNVGCVVARLRYGETAFMLPCDTTSAVEMYLARLDGERLKSAVLKAAHHGSKTSSSPVFVGYVAPEYAVYSRGCDNSYGHPHAQTVAVFARFAIPTLDTCKEGTISFVSDGTHVTYK
ncbi:MAG: ComEC/Rec2 family competence protein [Minisyncoccota bacterium]